MRNVSYLAILPVLPSNKVLMMDVWLVPVHVIGGQERQSKSVGIVDVQVHRGEAAVIESP